MRWRLLLIASVFCAFAKVGAVILFRSGDPAENTSAPAGDLADSGWQYQGFWGGFTGTPIAPHFFLSAQHIGHQGSFSWNGVAYRVVAKFDDPRSDLAILQVAEPFPFFAPLYSRLDEVGQRIAEFGRGRQRGAARMIDGVLKGWDWGGLDRVLRWGENKVAGVIPYGAENELLYADFDENGLANECHLAEGDSGGAAFINDAGTWKLAGINFAVDGPLYHGAAGEGEFTAALFDARGYYYRDRNGIYVLIEGANPAPTALYPTRISRRLPWIATTVAAPVLAREGTDLTLTYTKFVMPESDLVYRVEQSTDLASWTTAPTTEDAQPPIGSVQIVKARVPVGGTTKLFLRLRISRP